MESGILDLGLILDHFFRIYFAFLEDTLHHTRRVPSLRSTRMSRMLMLFAIQLPVSPLPGTAG